MEVQDDNDADSSGPETDPDSDSSCAWHNPLGTLAVSDDDEPGDDARPSLAEVVLTVLDWMTKHKATVSATKDLWNFWAFFPERYDLHHCFNLLVLLLLLLVVKRVVLLFVD